MIGELRIISNEAIMTYSRYYPGIFQERLKKITMTWDKIICILPEIRPQHLLNAKRERFRYVSLFGVEFMKRPSN
jgi:hypothetical protein